MQTVSILFTAAWLLLAGAAAAQSVSKREYLWPKGAPGALDNTEASKPSVVVYAPATGKANGAGALVLGGGGYTGIAFDAESIPAAKWLNSIGVTAFVLTYRLAPAYRHPIEMQDAQRAMRWIRANAARFGIDVHRLGVVGFSAGGHLGSTIAVHNDQGNSGATDSVDRHSCRPNFQILVYPVITMDTLNHGSSRGNLLGPNPPADLLEFLSNEKHVTAATPPAFLVHGKDDARVPVANSQLYLAALRQAGVPAELKLYDHGPHGFGLADGSGGTPVDSVLATWPRFAGEWLKAAGFLSAAPAGLRRPLRIAPARFARGHDALGRKPRARAR
jgi:acetyl esterase/lipase